MKKNVIFTQILFLSACLSMSMPVFASTKNYSLDVNKDYSSAKIVIDIPKDGTEYAAEVYLKSDKKYEATKISDTELECVINDPLDKGKWTISVNRADDVDEEVYSLGGVKVHFEGSFEKLVDANKDITVATDIVGLKTYFKDDDFVAEWSDTSCGNVNIEVTNEKTMETIAKETIGDERYLAVPISSDVESIIFKIVPSVSASVKDAVKQYVFKVDNHPDATITFEDIEITNRDEINVHAVINDSYRLIMLNNDKEVSRTEFLTPGEYDFTVPTQAGDNYYTVYVEAENGNLRSTKGYVEKDVVAPILQLDKDYVEIITEEEIITFGGKVEDYDTFTINDAPVELEGDHTFKYDYKLKEGNNVIHITASDRAGNVSEYISTVYYQIPVEDPIPWVKIIIIACAVVLIGIYIFEVIKRSRSNEEAPVRNAKAKVKKTASKTGKNYIINEIATFVVPVAVIATIFNFVILIGVVQSSSMEPTLNVGDTCFYNQLAYKNASDVQRGDIIDFDSATLGKHISKRVIGLPGDVIEFKDGYVVINGQYCDETDYLVIDQETNSLKTFTVPSDSFFVLGDNRDNSLDSRYWENPYVPYENINGKYMGKIEFSLQYDIFGGQR